MKKICVSVNKEQKMEKKKVLFDLNIDGDCTNLGSLAVLNILANYGEAEMLATTACYKSPLATGCIKAINRYYGHGDVPVGILHCQDETHPTAFPSYINQIYCTDNPFGEDVEDTVTVMRRALADQEDESVVFIISGCFASAAALMQSEPDDISDLSGQELCDRKVTRLVVMAGHFGTFGENQFGENNVVVNIPAAQYVVSHWTKELVLSGFEIGWRIQTLKEFRRFGPDKNPLKMIYNIHDGSLNNPTGDNPSWDHTAVLEGVHPGQHFCCHEFGRIIVNDKGITEWHPEEGGKMTYLLPKGGNGLEDVREYINTLIFPEWKQFSSGY